MSVEAKAGNIKTQLLTDETTVYVGKQFSAALRDMGERDDGAAIESEIAGLDHKTGKVLDAIENVGINCSLGERLRNLEAEKRSALDRLEAARIDAAPPGRSARPDSGSSEALAPLSR